MEFRVLGPLEVLDAGQVLPLGSGRQRALLALLLVHPNEALAVDRIVDELWEGSPPATAAKIVQVYVSQLRKALGEGRIVTQRPGYLLRVEVGELDVDRVAALRAQALEADPAATAGLLREALAVWRGEPLADLNYNGFVQPELARLGELRLAVLEDRIDADLALGRHADLLPELESLVARHPLQERLRAQQMLALYRCGRQANALAAYQDARRTLDTQLGIQPGEQLRTLEQAILNQDATLAAPAPTPEARAAARGRRRGLRLVVAAAALLLVAAVAAGAVELTRSGGTASRATVQPDALGVIDPSTNRIVGQLPIVGSVSKVAVAGGLVWVWGDASRTLSAIAPASLKVRHQLAPGAFADELAAGSGHLWLLDAGGRRLVEIDPIYASVVKRISLPPTAASERTAVDEGLANVRLATGADSLWVTDGSRYSD
jgi:DNA-binding SARP family transcriptional activator